MWQLSRRSRYIREALEAHGADFSLLESYHDLAMHVREACLFKVQQMGRQVAALHGIDFVHGEAFLEDPHRVRISAPISSSASPPITSATAAHILVATGSRPRLHPRFPADGRSILTSDHILDLQTFPKVSSKTLDPSASTGRPN